MSTDLFSVAALVKKGCYEYYRQRRTKRRIVTNNMIRGDRFARAFTSRNRGHHEVGGVIEVDSIRLSFRIDAYIDHFYEVKWVNPIYRTAPTLFHMALIQVAAYNHCLRLADIITDEGGTVIVPQEGWETRLYFDGKVYVVEPDDGVLPLLVAKAKAIQQGDIYTMLELDRTIQFPDIRYRRIEVESIEHVSWTI